MGIAGSDLFLVIPQIEYKVEEFMYSMYMMHGEDSPEYQGIVAKRREAISKAKYIHYTIFPST